MNIYVFSHPFLSNYMKINDENMHAIIEIKTPRPGIVVLNPQLGLSEQKPSAIRPRVFHAQTSVADCNTTMPGRGVLISITTTRSKVKSEASHWSIAKF